MHEFQLAAVENIFAAFPERHRQPLLTMRDWIFEASNENPQIGPISEEIRWGQPSYLTRITKAGTSVRLDRWHDAHIGLFFHCQSRLGDQFQALYGDKLTIVRHRLIRLDPDAPLPETILRHCIKLALTYHSAKQ